MSQEPLRIVLGPRWAFFTYQREDLELLGTVQRGMQIGALARLPDGNYAQVNGDIVGLLNKSRVEFALRSAGGAKAARAPLGIARPPAPAATVTVKKRRRIVLPPQG